MKDTTSISGPHCEFHSKSDIQRQSLLGSRLSQVYADVGPTHRDVRTAREGSFCFGAAGNRQLVTDLQLQVSCLWQWMWGQGPQGIDDPTHFGWWAPTWARF